MNVVDYVQERNSQVPLMMKRQAPDRRINRVMEIRHELDTGQYNLAKYLNVAVDRLLEELLR